MQRSESKSCLELRLCKRRRRSHDCSLHADLVLEEILPRLPVESLTRFKCVSKKWLDYITHPRLVSSHLRHHSQTSKLSVVSPVENTYRYRRLFFLDHLRGNKVEVTDITSCINNLAHEFKSYRTVGSCDGLICLRLLYGRFRREAVLLFNPETREGRDVRAPQMPSSYYKGRPYRDYHVFGFGFDSDRNDYKVVRVIPTRPTLLNIDVFSRNTGEWRRLETGLSGYMVSIESHNPVLLDGCLYWLILAVQSYQRCILSFDLRTEKLRVIADEPRGHLSYSYAYTFPDDEDFFHIHPTPHRLVKWKERLAYLSFPDKLRYEIGFQLVFDSNGRDDVGSFRWSGKPSPPGADEHSEFSGVSRDMFFTFERKLSELTTSQMVMYDPFEPDYDRVGHREVLSMTHVNTNWEVHDYVKSLVSVYPNREAMIRDKREAKMRHWVDLFWKTYQLSKDWFAGLV